MAAGATVGTHVFNCMPPPHHRAPGPVYALLGAPGVTCELIADGEHLADGTLAFAARVAGPDGVALVTDAIAAAGMPDGDYDLGDQAVTVRAGVARLGPATGSPGALAGSTLTMDAAFRRYAGLRRMAGRDADQAMVDAALASATNAARALSLRDRGALVVGRRADLVTLDASLAVTGVIQGGRPV
jgi:N-acetylglucosamine-6-phosphate deacetylase